MKKVLLAQALVPEAMKLLVESNVKVMLSPDPDDRTIRKYIKGSHALILRTATKLSRETIFASDVLQVISRTGAGYDNIDVEAASEKGIPVCNTPEANTVTVAEHTFSMLLYLSKQLGRLDEGIREGNWKIRDSNTSIDIAGKTIGLIGYGKIGQEVARLAAAFNMRIVIYDPYVKEESHSHSTTDKMILNDLEDLLIQSDFISLHAPLTSGSRGIIGDKEFKSMKKNAYLINTSRGGLIVEESLVKALKENRIAGAALDVFDEEPLNKENPLCQMKNVLLTPHTAALTKECKLRVALTAVQSVLEVLNGANPARAINSILFKGEKNGSS